MATVVVFYTNTALTSITLPADYGTPSKIECIGGGGGGTNTTGSHVGCGGAGGAYATKANPSGFAASGIVNCNIGTGGANGLPAVAGGNTWIGGSSFATATCAAPGGAGAIDGTGGAGSSTGAIGDTVAAGGSGGSKGNDHFAGAGGGGAAGPGGAGGAGPAPTAAGPGGGGGGAGNTGGAGGAGTTAGVGGVAGDGTAGGAVATTTGTTGGTGSHGSGGGAGSGNSATSGGPGGAGNESTWDSSHGPGGGGGGGGGGLGTCHGGAGGLYGGGGGGGPWSGLPGGAGAQGIIVLTYTSTSSGLSGALSDSVATSDTYTATLLNTNSFSASVATSDSFASQLTIATVGLSDSVATSDNFSGSIAIGGILADSVITSDEFDGSLLAPESLSDSITTSDLFQSSLGPVFGSLSDSVATSDAYQASALGSLSDTIATSDEYDEQLSGHPLHEFSGLAREALVSGGGSVDLLYSGVVRETLFTAANSTSVHVNFASLVREVLVGNNYDFTNVNIPQSFGPLPIFPILPEGFPVQISPVMDTTIGTTKSLRELRVAQQEFPLWDIELLFEELRDQTQNQAIDPRMSGFVQYMELAQLFIMMYGQSNVFCFDCPWDDSRTDQAIGVGDGKTYIFNIYRTWSSDANPTTAPVGAVNEVFNVKVNGTLIDASKYYIIRDKIYFIDEKGFVYPPGNGLTITMTFSFYYLCRFTEDEQNFEEFSQNRWTVTSLKIRAVIWQ